MKTLIKTAISVVFTLAILSVATTRYTQLHCENDSAELTLDRQQLGSDLAVASDTAARINEWFARISGNLQDSME